MKSDEGAAVRVELCRKYRAESCRYDQPDRQWKRMWKEWTQCESLCWGTGLCGSQMRDTTRCDAFGPGTMYNAQITMGVSLFCLQANDEMYSVQHFKETTALLLPDDRGTSTYLALRSGTGCGSWHVCTGTPFIECLKMLFGGRYLGRSAYT